MEFSIVEEAVGSCFLVKLTAHVQTTLVTLVLYKHNIATEHLSQGKENIFGCVGAKTKKDFFQDLMFYCLAGKALNGWGPEAKRMMRVQGAEPPEAFKFWPHLGTKISILKPHFYFLDFFYLLFCTFFFCHPLFFLGAALPGISKP